MEFQDGMFGKTGLPILLHGCEIYDFENLELVERVLLRY